MSAYNSVNGEWCGQHTHLLTEILRDEWGWDGFVTSDFIFGLRDPVGSVAAGLDIEMPFRQQRATVLADALADGSLAPAVVDRAVQRIVATLLRFSTVFEQQPSIDVVGCEEHRTLAREVAAASTVLLRNDGALLPLAADSVERVAVLGRLAAVRNLGDGGSSDVARLTRGDRARRRSGALRCRTGRPLRRRRLDRSRRGRGHRRGRLHEGRRGRVHRGGRRRCARPRDLPAARPPVARHRRAVDGATRPGSTPGTSGRRRRRSHGTRR